MIDKKLSGATNTMPAAMSLVKELPQYESLVRSIDGIVWEADADTFQFRFVNERAEKILGYPVEQWLAEPEFWVNHLHPADREWATNFCLTATQRKEDHEFEYRMIAADGREVWLRDTVTVNYAADGSTLLRGVMFDITSQMTALNDVRAAETRMRLLFDQIPAVIWTTDTDLRFTNITGRGLSSMHVTDGSRTGMSLSEYFETDDPDFEAIAAHRCALSGESPRYNLEWTGRLFDSFVEPLRNAVGEIVGCVGVAVDVTERSIAEANILKEKELTEAILESTPGLFYMFNQKGERLRWNKTYQDFIGLPPEQIRSAPFLALIAEKDRPAVRESFEKVLAEGEATVEADAIANDGILRPYMLTGRRLEIDGEPCVVGMGIDISERKLTEEALRSSEERFRIIVEDQTEMIVRWKPDGTRTFVNQAYCEAFGGSAGDLIGTSFFPLVVEKYREAIRKKISSLTPEHPTATEAHESLSASGEIRWQEWTDRGIFDESGNLVELQSVGRDITERKRAEEALLLSEIRSRTIVENAPEAIVVFDMATGKFVDFNPQALALFKLTADQILKIGAVEMSPPFQPDGQASGDAATAVFKQALAGETPVFEWMHINSDGETIPCEVRLLQLPDDTRTLVRGSITDITERKRIRENLIASEERYRDLVENAIDIIFTHDLDGYFTSINKAGERILGYTNEEAQTMTFSQILAPEYVEKAFQLMANSVSGLESTVEDLEVFAKDGRRVAFEVNSRAIYQNGVPVGVQGMARDVTERRQLEEQLRQSQKLEGIGLLAGGIAHDFNNMLTAINGYSDMILRKLHADDPIRTSVEEIRKAGERSAALTHQLLAFSRKQVLQPKILDLNAVVAGIEKMLRRLIGENIDLKTIPGENLGSVRADPGQIEQVIMNLIVNARDAMPVGGNLTIETRNFVVDKEFAEHHVPTKEGQYVLLAVSDTGIGIEDEAMKHIFEPFYTTKEHGKGTGLGLATVYGIIKQSNGYIWVSSVLGQGTGFYVFLPRVDQGSRKKKNAGEIESPHVGTETILLIEDEDIVRDLTRKMLESCGYRVLVAANGEDAISICGHLETPIDLLITDVVMPTMNGPDVAADLSRSQPDLRILYISGHPDETIVHHGILDSGIDFLQKPFSVEALSQKVREVLDRKLLPN